MEPSAKDALELSYDPVEFSFFFIIFNHCSPPPNIGLPPHKLQLHCRHLSLRFAVPLYEVLCGHDDGTSEFLQVIERHGYV